MPEAPVEHLVQEAVAGIVVVIAIAAEPELFVEVGVERRDPHRGRRPLMALKPSSRGLAHSLEALQYGAASSAGYSTPAIASAAGASDSPGSFSARRRSSVTRGRRANRGSGTERL